MHSIAGYIFIAFIAAFFAAAYASWRWWVVGQWKHAAAALGVNYESRSGLRTGFVEGVSGRYPLALKTEVSFEDGPAYHHTSAVITCNNPGSVVLALRRKSVLEQFASRHDTPQASTGDGDFDALFFVVSNDRADIDTLLGPEIRRRLKPLDDIEIFVRGEQVVVRRPGERKQARELLEMAGLAEATADVLATFPPRPRSLVEQMEDEELLKEGI